MLVVTSPSVFSQNVKGGVVAGFNGSQVEGDNVNGFYKWGGTIGGIAALPLSHKLTLRGEVLYNQKGSRTYPVQTIEFARYYNLTLDYVEVPITLHYHDIKEFNVGAGVSIGALVRSREVVQNFNIPKPNYDFQEAYPYEQFDLTGVIDLNYLFHPQWSVNIRWAYSLLPIRQNPPPFNADYQHNHVVSLRLIYYFNQMFEENSDHNIATQSSS